MDLGSNNFEETTCFNFVPNSASFPGNFGSIQDARVHCRSFFGWYNDEHRHSGIGLMTPSDIHYGRAEIKLAHRSEVLKMAFEKQPRRFKGKMPKPPAVPGEVWINKPKSIQEIRL